MSGSDSDYEDPLFGIQKKRPRRSQTPEKGLTQISIFDALKAHSKKSDDLGIELGFKIRENDHQDTKRIHLDLVNLENKIKRGKHVEGVLNNVNKHMSNIKEQNKFVDEFLNDNLYEGFRKDEANKAVIEDLKKHVLESIQSSDPDLIPKRFKFFIGMGVVSHGGGLEANSVFESDNLELVEREFEGKYFGDLSSLLSNLGCDFRMINNGPMLKFDTKQPLVWPLCIQVLKFVKIIDNNNEYKYEDIIKVLLMMSVDENLILDTTMIEYKEKSYTGRQLAVLKIMEWSLKDRDQFLDILSEFFEFDDHDIWIRVIKGVYIINQSQREMQLDMLNRMILRFMIDNDTDDGCEFTLQSDKSAIGEFIRFVITWGKCQLQSVTHTEYSLVLDKMECLERVFILNRVAIINHPLVKEMKVALMKMKSRYFYNHQASLSAVIPKTKSIIEFISTEIGDDSIDDFFAN